MGLRANLYEAKSYQKGVSFITQNKEDSSIILLAKERMPYRTEFTVQ